MIEGKHILNGRLPDERFDRIPTPVTGGINDFLLANQGKPVVNYGVKHDLSCLLNLTSGQSEYKPPLPVGGACVNGFCGMAWRRGAYQDSDTGSARRSS
jgi:hypothetical protein